MIKCIVFGFDGTLVDSNHIKIQGFYEITQSCDPSGSIVTDILRRFPGKDRFYMTRAIAQEIIAQGRWPALASLDECARHLVQEYTRFCEQTIVSCPERSGATTILRWLSAKNMPLFVNSATPVQTLTNIMTLRWLDHYFSGVYGFPASKVDNLCDMRDSMKVKEEEILFVGDGESDQSAAVIFGCHFVGVITDNHVGFREQPENTIGNLVELKIVLGKIQESQNVS